MTKYKAIKILGKKYDAHRIIANAIKSGFNTIVHHKDGDKYNNEIDNLEIMSRTEHCKLHGFGTTIRPKAKELFIPDEKNMAKCKKCECILPWDDFANDKNAYYGKRSMCKKCAAKLLKEWRHKKQKV